MYLSPPPTHLSSMRLEKGGLMQNRMRKQFKYIGTCTEQKKKKKKERKQENL